MKKNKFFKKYINSPSPSGHELRLGGQQVWIDYIKKYSYQVKTDNYGNAYAYYNKPKKDYKTILIDAHADEIGYVVFDIDDKGFIKIARLGGSDINITPSARVDIWIDKDKKIQGVFGHPAIHIQKDFKVKIENCFIDIGASSRKEVEDKGIEIGTPITMSDGYFEMDNYYCGRSLDDKIGGYITTQLLRKLNKNNAELDFNLVIVNSVQEEVGIYGAKMASNLIKPDVAIAIDVCHDTTSPAYNRSKQGHVVAGEGCVLMNGPSIQKNLLQLLKDTAKENDIKYQMIATGGSSGTNADSYAYPNGIPTALLSLAMRYMHTTVETVHEKDVDSSINLLYSLIIEGKLKNDLKY